ncbi:MAG: hypothetical protein K0S07_1735, partial [Chlamydiales bacterium]|nr:hypothetical protein [Chlamydiales bacterium]
MDRVDRILIKKDDDYLGDRSKSRNGKTRFLVSAINHTKQYSIAFKVSKNGNDFFSKPPKLGFLQSFRWMPIQVENDQGNIGYVIANKNSIKKAIGLSRLNIFKTNKSIQHDFLNKLKNFSMPLPPEIGGMPLPPEIGEMPLPPEIWGIVFSHLGRSDLSATAATSKQFKGLTHHALKKEMLLLKNFAKKILAEIPQEQGHLQRELLLKAMNHLDHLDLEKYGFTESAKQIDEVCKSLQNEIVNFLASLDVEKLQDLKNSFKIHEHLIDTAIIQARLSRFNQFS